MNRKDLIAAQSAGKTVAYAEFDGIDTEYAREAKIINTQAPRAVSSSGRMPWLTHTATGVEIEFVGGRYPGKREVVASVKLVATWADYEEHKRARHEREARREATASESEALAKQQAARLAALYEAATGTKPRYGMIDVQGNGHSSGNYYIPRTRYNVVVDPRILEVILSSEKG